MDGSALIEAETRKLQAELEQTLDLRAPVSRSTDLGSEIEVIFRASAGKYPVSSRLYITGLHEQLGGLIPNKIAMHDDGKSGDQRPKDNVWSYSATLPTESTIYYTYTNSGESGKWEGLDVPAVRRLDLTGQSTPFYSGIDVFGEMTLHADPWHTNSAGNELIANALLEEIRKLRVREEHQPQL